MQLPARDIYGSYGLLVRFPEVGGNMLTAPGFLFYMCAKYLTAMANLADGTSMRGNATAIKVFGRAEGVCEGIVIDEFWLKYLPSSVKRAQKLLDLIRRDIFMGEDKVCETLSATHMEWIRNGVHAFEISLCNEIGNMPLFCCEDSKLGNLSIDKLLKGASNGYPEQTRTKLTPECLTEIDEAGKCLALREKHSVRIPYSPLSRVNNTSISIGYPRIRHAAVEPSELGRISRPAQGEWCWSGSD